MAIYTKKKFTSPKKVGRPEIGAAHKSQKVGRPWPVWPNRLRCQCSTYKVKTGMDLSLYHFCDSITKTCTWWQIDRQTDVCVCDDWPRVPLGDWRQCPCLHAPAGHHRAVAPPCTASPARPAEPPWTDRSAAVRPPMTSACTPHNVHSLGHCIFSLKLKI